MNGDGYDFEYFEIIEGKEQELYDILKDKPEKIKVYLNSKKTDYGFVEMSLHTSTDSYLEYNVICDYLDYTEQHASVNCEVTFYLQDFSREYEEDWYVSVKGYRSQPLGLVSLGLDGWTFGFGLTDSDHWDISENYLLQNYLYHWLFDSSWVHAGSRDYNSNIDFVA